MPAPHAIGRHVQAFTHTHTHGEVAKDHNQRLLPLMSNPLTLVRLRNLSRVYDGFPGFQVLGLAWRHKMEKQIRDPSVPGSYHIQQTGVFVGLSPVCEPQAPSFRNRMKSANHHQNPSLRIRVYTHTHTPLSRGNEL